MRSVPAFSLRDSEGESRTFPGERPALLCFLHRECPTCELSLPAIEAAYAGYGERMDVWVIAQDEDGGAKLRAEHGLSVPVLDDSELSVSFAAGIETVPTVVVFGPGGEEARRFEGFAVADWRRLFSYAADATGLDADVPDWSSFPELRPGCGSRSVEPGIAERLEARAAGSPLHARRIELGSAVDPFEFAFEQGLSDGLPVVPPTPERVLRMLEGTPRDSQEVVAQVPPNYAPASVEKVAINAVMAGCRPEYLPVVLAGVEAVCTPEFNVHGVLATTFFATPVLLVNGPIRARIGMNSGMNCLGQGNRANSTIGRAVQLVVRNVGGGRPGEIDRAALGQPGKLSMCFAENEERSNWEPFHVERGFEAETSTITAFAGGAPTGFVDQLARDARTLATSYGLALASVGHPKHYFAGEIIVVVPPEHVDTFGKDGWTKNQVREQIQKASERPVSELMRNAECAEGLPEAVVERLGGQERVPKFQSADKISLVVAGGEAGKFGAYFQGWVSGPVGSIMTTRAIGD